MRVVLNVGGNLFETTRETLLARDSFFSGLDFCDESSPIFVDRDPTHFRQILNYMRNTLIIPSRLDDLLELRAEAMFYSLSELVTLLNRSLKKYSFMEPVEINLEKIVRCVSSMR